MCKPYVLGIDIGGTNTVFGMVDARGEVIASLDGFKAVLNSFDISVSSWKGWNFLAFIVIFTNQMSLDNFIFSRKKVATMK